MDRLLRLASDHAERADVAAVSDSGELLQRSLGRRGKLRQLRKQEVDNIIGVSFGTNAIDIGGPARGIMIAGKRAPLSERREELDGKERIAADLVVDQSREASHYPASSAGRPRSVA